MHQQRAMHNARVLLALHCLLLCTYFTKAQQATVRDELQKKGYTHFITLAEAAGLKQPAPNAVLTIFAPTNQAIDAFLQKMRLTLSDIKSRPGLAAAVAAYHVLPRVKGRIADVKGMTQDKPLEAITADGNHFLKFFMSPEDKVVIQDVQNNTANVVGPGVEIGNVMLYGIDKVLLSGDVFYTLADLLARHPDFQPLKDVFAQAGLEDDIRNMVGEHNSITVWAPTAKAVKSAQSQLSALSRSELQDVLRYHIVPAALPIPERLEAGKLYPTAFKGHNLKFKYNIVPSSAVKAGPPKGKQEEEQARKTVEIIPEDGTFSKQQTADAMGPVVNLANLFANRMVIHGIDQVLKPKLPSQSSAASKPIGRAGGSSKARKLLQYRRSPDSGPSMVSAGMTSAQSSIRAAVDGRESIEDATFAGGSSAKTASTRCWNCMVDDNMLGH